MRRGDLPALVLKDVAQRSLQDAGPPAAALVETRGVLAQLRARAPGFDADHAYPRVGEERVEESDGVRAAADAGDERVGQAPRRFENLRARLSPDDALEVAHHARVWMWAEGAAQQIVSVGNVRHPVAQRLVDGVLERARAGVNLAHFRAEQAHAKDVQRLAAHVFSAHVDDAAQAEESADRGRGDAVLARARLGDDATLAHASREQDLSERVVDLVRACVREVFALEVELRAARVFR